MRSIVEFCAGNMHNGTDRVMKRMKQTPGVDVIEYGCLGNCGQCYLDPYALVNGEIVSAETADELYEAIMAKIKEAETGPSGLPLE
ncbi:YuzB family protein [Paenibacillus thermotolerans]|uniref:YuzB family protein n=1 Tax=Paenibacillus thermotolerans TaxID=3027807 RepID=UPI00236772CA|nr:MULTISPECIES: YuzB family protein [unclassified Paenibacillus]